MTKRLILLCVLFTAHINYAQVKTVFPLSAKRGIKTVSFSLSETCAILSDVYIPANKFGLSVYDLNYRKPVKTLRLESDQEVQPYYVSNNGRYIECGISGGVGSSQVYDIKNRTFNESSSDNQYGKMIFSNQDAEEVYLEDAFPNEDFQDWWFTKQFAAKVNGDSLLIYDTIQKKTTSYSVEPFKGLKNYFKNEFSISENGNYLLYNKGKRLYLFDLIKVEKIWESDFKIKRIDDVAVFDNGVVCFGGKYGKEKAIGIHWYDIHKKEFLDHSTQDQILNIPYASQFYKFLSVGYGTTHKKRVQKSQYIDLSSGNSSSLKAGKGWTSFNKVQKFVKDTLSKSLLTQAEFDTVRSKRVYYRYWEMKSDYYDDNGYNPKTKNPQVEAPFFELIDSLDLDITVLTADNNKVTFQDISGDLPFFGLTLQKQVIYFWNGNMENPEERLVKFIMTKDEKPLFFADDNYYFSPASFTDAIGFEQDLKYYPAEQFDLKYNRPDIILKRLGYADQSIIEAYHQAYLKRLKKMGFTEDMLEDDFHIPEIKIENFEKMPTITDSSFVDLSLTMMDDKYQLDRINVWVNDVAIYGTDGISLREYFAKKHKTNLKVSLVKGKNEVQISVLNQAGAESYKEHFEIKCNVGKTKPDLYLITIGESEFLQSEYDLTYAAKDAEDVAQLFEGSKLYNKVFTKTLINKDVTKANVISLKSFLNNADINDEVMIFIAGHGVLDNQLDYYFASYDMNFSDPSKKGIAYSDLEGLLDGIKPLKKVLLIDACHSGEIDKDEIELATNTTGESGDIQFRSVGNSAQPKLGIQNTSELTRSLFTDLRKGTGATVISSAGGLEFAMEGDLWNNGLFTYALINGIKSGAADLNGDNEIWLTELKQYVADQVTQLSKGKQQPSSRIENKTVDFRVW